MGKDSKLRKILASDVDWVIVIRENGEVETNMEDGQASCQYRGLFLLVVGILEKIGAEPRSKPLAKEDPEEPLPILNILPPRLVS